MTDGGGRSAARHGRVPTRASQTTTDPLVERPCHFVHGPSLGVSSAPGRSDCPGVPLKPARPDGAVPGPWCLIISSRHRHELTGVVASMRRLVEANPSWFDWQAPDGMRSHPLCDEQTVLVNGAFTFDDVRALEWVEERLRSSTLPVHVYWHETAVALRRLAGTGDCYVSDRERRRHRWSRIRDVVTHANVTNVGASHAVRCALLDTFGLPPDRTRVIYECAPTPYPYPRFIAPDVLRISSAGSTDPRKRQSLFDRLAVENRVLAGRTTVWSWYGESFAGRGAVYRGFATDLADRLRREDIYVSLAVDEPFSVAGVEALAAGLPVLCLAGTGLAEVVPTTWVIHDLDAVPTMIGCIADTYRENSATALSIAHDLAVSRFSERFLDAVALGREPTDSAERAAIAGPLPRTALSSPSSFERP